VCACRRCNRCPRPSAAAFCASAADPDYA
jgi:hypothetical protein